MVEYTQELNTWNPFDSIFIKKVIESGYLYFQSSNWLTEAKLADVGLLEGAIGSKQDQDGYEVVLQKWDNAIVWIANNQGNLHTHIAGVTQQAAEDGMAHLQELLPKLDANSDDHTSTIINFWSLGPHGPANFMRRIAIPEWKDIQPNYSESVRGELDRLMSFENGRWSENGQLLLWQGEPGTGKTYALRAMANSWREWCDFHYITDSDQFFGGSSNYLLSVLLSGSSPVDSMGVDDYWDEAATYPGSKKKQKEQRWKLLILEDAGELLTADASSVVGQALSRLLNTVDGMIGQGLRVIVLVTTNEEIGKLHPALSRHGRCASQIEFQPLTPDESRAWLDSHGSDNQSGGRYSLAELYGLLAGNDEAEKISVGFA